METTPETPELTYDPYATIVYNAHPYAYSGINAVTVSASDVSSTFRNDKIRSEKIVKTNGQIEKVKEYLIENYEELDEHAEAIANLLDIELSREVEFEMTVTITGTIILPVGKDFDDLSEWDFDIEVSCNESDYELESFDASIDRMREVQTSQQVGKDVARDNHINKNPHYLSN